jgi:hypothetical protein
MQASQTRDTFDIMVKHVKRWINKLGNGGKMGLFGPNVKQMAARNDYMGLIQVLKSEKDANVRTAAARALAKNEFCKDVVISALEEALGDSDLEVRKAAEVSRNYLIEMKKVLDRWDEQQKKMSASSKKQLSRLGDSLEKIKKM